MPPGPAPKSSDHKSSRRNRSSVGCVIISPEDTDVNAPQVSRSLSIPYPTLDTEPHAAECKNTEDFKPRRIQSRPTKNINRRSYTLYIHIVFTARDKIDLKPVSSPFHGPASLPAHRSTGPTPLHGKAATLV